MLKVDVVPDSALSLLALGEDKLVISCYRPTPGAGYVLQKSHDLVEWSDLEQILDSSATFQWVDDRFADRIFHRLK